MSTETILRNTDLRSLIEHLKAEHSRKHDVIVPERMLSFANTDDGLTVNVPEVMEGTDIRIDTPCTVTSKAVGDLADRLAIPVAYLRRMLAEADHRPLAVSNLGHWAERSTKSVMLRSFFNGEGGGVLRAVLSDRYRSIDHLDTIYATLEGFRQAGVRPTTTVANLTDGRLDIRFTSEDVAINIADLVGDYRHGGRSGSDLPMLFAGFSLRNNETGGGAYSLVPMVVVQVCTNGMTRVKDAYRAIHLGEKLEEGVIEWSAETIQRQLALITSKTCDVVKATLSTDFLDRVANEMREAKGVVITKPAETIKAVSKTLRWTEEQGDAILASFIAGGDVTALGLGQAVTATAQKLRTGEAQADAEDSFWSVIEATKVAVRVIG